MVAGRFGASVVAIFAAIAVISLNLPAFAQEDPPAAAAKPAKPKAPRPAKPKPADAAADKPVPAKPAAKAAGKGSVLVDNRRDTTLVELTLMPKGKGAGAPLVIARDVASGGKVNAKLPAKAGCVFDVSGSFDDESVLEVASVNLCKDGRLTLVE